MEWGTCLINPLHHHQYEAIAEIFHVLHIRRYFLPFFLPLMPFAIRLVLLVFFCLQFCPHFLHFCFCCIFSRCQPCCMLAFLFHLLISFSSFGLVAAFSFVPAFLCCFAVALLALVFYCAWCIFLIKFFFFFLFVSGINFLGFVCALLWLFGSGVVWCCFLPSALIAFLAFRALAFWLLPSPIFR